MAYQISTIEGIGSTFAAKLKEAGINTTDDLLSSAAAPAGRKSLAEQTGLTTAQILKWANKADLLRVSGIGEEYSDLLEASGVDTVKELRNRNATNLAAKMEEVNAEKKLVRKTPSESQVTKWVEAAKGMEPMLTY
ncbi:MAG: DUF4332 domain-containing protein [Alphaproteobacteria bacterium]